MVNITTPVVSVDFYSLAEAISYCENKGHELIFESSGEPYMLFGVNGVTHMKIPCEIEQGSSTITFSANGYSITIPKEHLQVPEFFTWLKS